MKFDRFTHERERLAKGCERIAGVDEVGRGPLAGPVVAAAAVFLPGHIRDGLPEPSRMRIDIHDEVDVLSLLCPCFV